MCISSSLFCLHLITFLPRSCYMHLISLTPVSFLIYSCFFFFISAYLISSHLTPDSFLLLCFHCIRSCFFCYMHLISLTPVSFLFVSASSFSSHLISSHLTPDSFLLLCFQCIRSISLLFLHAMCASFRFLLCFLPCLQLPHSTVSLRQTTALGFSSRNVLLQRFLR
jgi:hypothetical protein